MNLDNLSGINCINPLLIGRPYLPFTTTSLKPIVINYLLNDVVINQRKNILELGSGISTILLARLMDQNGLDVKITSVDHNKKWLDLVKSLLEKEGLLGKVNLIHAQLSSEKEFNKNKYKWYDEAVLSMMLGTNYDLVLIDGPPAWNPEIEFSRIFAFPFLKGRMNTESFRIIIDDISRNGEKEALSIWSALFNLEPKVLYNQIGSIAKNSFFDINPI
jgi:hypothetical protein